MINYRENFELKRNPGNFSKGEGEKRKLGIELIGPKTFYPINVWSVGIGGEILTPGAGPRPAREKGARETGGGRNVPRA